MKKRVFCCSAYLLLAAFILYAEPGGRVEKVTFHSPSLGIQKSFNIYLPEGYDEPLVRYPVVYICRGGEDEWLVRTKIIALADSKIKNGEMGKMILVFPGLTFEGNRMIGFPVNMNNIEPLGEREGLGTGRFEDYFVKDLIPYVDDNYNTIPDRRGRGIDGFSGGAVTSILMGVKHPDLFLTVGAYDGPWGYLDFDDPSRTGQYDDSIWMHLDLFDPYFGNPRDLVHMKRYNSTNVIRETTGAQLETLQDLNFFIRSAGKNARSAFIEGTYYPRTVHLVEILNSKGIENYWKGDSLILAPDAEHEWPDAREHLGMTLPLHWKEFAARMKPALSLIRHHRRQHVAVFHGTGPQGILRMGTRPPGVVSSHAHLLPVHIQENPVRFFQK